MKIRKVGLPKGGTTNQILKKTSGSDYDTEWATGGTGGANLGYDSATRTVTSDSGTDAVLTLADVTNPGLLTSTDFTKLSNTSGTNTGDQAITNSSDATSHTVTLSASGGSVQLIEGTNITLTTGGTGAAGTVTIAATSGGITNAAVANEMMKSDGTNAIASGLFSTTDGSLNLGDSTTFLTNRTIDAGGTGADINILIRPKGVGGLTLGTTTTQTISQNFSDQNIFTATTALTNTVKNLIRLDHSTSGTPAAGIGTGISLRTETTAGLKEGTIIESVTTDVGSGTEDFDLVLKNMAAGAAAAEGLRIKSTKQLQLAGYTTSSSYSGTPVGYLQYDSSGNVITAAIPTGGGDMVLADVQTVTGAKTFGTIGGAVGKLILAGSTSGSTILNASAVAGTTTVTVPAQTGTLLINTATSGVGATPTASGTTAITHGLGRTPTIIRIYSGGGFTSNAAATPTTYSMGTFSSSGNRCIYQGVNGTTTIAAASSTVFSIYMITSAGNLISGVIGNVGDTTFDIVWTETGTHTRGVYMWEAQ